MMKSLLKRLFKILPHITIVMAGMMITFFIIDRFNTAMAFINNDITKWLLCVFSILSVITSIGLIYYQRRE